MNIFFSDPDPVVAAKNLCDLHVIKMMTETAQILCTVHRILDGVQGQIIKKGKLVNYKYTLNKLDENGKEPILYLASHVGNRFVEWAMESVDNYEWLYKHLLALVAEYKCSSGKTPKVCSILHLLHKPPSNIIRIGLTQKPLSENIPDGIDTYQKYVNLLIMKYEDFLTRTNKRRLKVEWKNRTVPQYWSNR